MLDKFVPIRETVKKLDLLLIINFASFPSLYSCLTQTSICNFLADIRAISDAENKTEKISPIIPKFNPNIVNYIPIYLSLII